MLEISVLTDISVFEFYRYIGGYFYMSIDISEINNVILVFNHRSGRGRDIILGEAMVKVAIILRIVIFMVHLKTRKIVPTTIS